MNFFFLWAAFWTGFFRGMTPVVALPPPAPIVTWAGDTPVIDLEAFRRSRRA